MSYIPRMNRDFGFFPYFYFPKFVPRELCISALQALPDISWDGWFPYSGYKGYKLASKPEYQLPFAYHHLGAYLVNNFALQPLTGIADAFPDYGLYAAGISFIPYKGNVPCHLDAKHHPFKPWERVASLMVYLNDHEGGELNVHHPETKEIVHSFQFQLGDLFFFLNSDTSWHSVSPVTSARRVSFNVFYWRELTPSPTGETPAKERVASQFHVGYP